MILESVILKNYRCFHEEQTARLAPLTLLVGENSTGKPPSWPCFGLCGTWLSVKSPLTFESLRMTLVVLRISFMMEVHGVRLTNYLMQGSSAELLN